MTMSRTLLVAGSGALLAGGLSDHLGPSGWTVRMIVASPDADLPTSTLHVEAANEDASLIEAAETSDATVLFSSPGGLEDVVADARSLDLLLGNLTPGSTLIAVTSLAIYGNARHHPVTEVDVPDALSDFDPMTALESRVLTANDWLRTVVVRSGLVFGAPDGDVVTQAVRTASEQGVSRYFGSETDLLPTVHHQDLMDLLGRLVREPGAAGVFHAASGAVSVQGMAQLIASAAEVTAVAPWDPDSMEAVLGTNPAVPRINVTSAVERSRASLDLGWTPDGPSLRETLSPA